MVFKMAEYIEGQESMSSFFDSNLKGYREIIVHGEKLSQDGIYSMAIKFSALYDY